MSSKVLTVAEFQQALEKFGFQLSPEDAVPLGEGGELDKWQMISTIRLAGRCGSPVPPVLDEPSRLEHWL